jgi:hypothetical protein
MADLPAPPGVVLMTVGDARREFPDRDIGAAMRAWGDSPAVPEDPDHWWCWVLDGGVEIRSRFPTREAAVDDVWRILWWVHEDHVYTPRDDKRRMAEAKRQFLTDRGWGFPEGYKDTRRKGNEVRRRQDEILREQREKLEKQRR